MCSLYKPLNLFSPSLNTLSYLFPFFALSPLLRSLISFFFLLVCLVDSHSEFCTSPLLIELRSVTSLTAWRQKDGILAQSVADKIEIFCFEEIHR